MISAGWEQDILQVCRNGHVITDRLRSGGEQSRSHCDRCGADTLCGCPTCGRPLPGALLVPGLAPVGAGRPPAYCSCCGARFPWTRPPEAGSEEALCRLEPLLRRLPLVIRQLRSRHGTRPPFAVADRHDLEDLLRSLLPLHFDSVRLRGHTPRYADANHTDLLLANDGIALTAKLLRPPVSTDAVAAQLREDRQRWQTPECRLLVACLYDPEAVLREPCVLEQAWSDPDEAPPLRCIIAVP